MTQRQIPPATRQQVGQALALMVVIGEVIRDTPGGIPAGHLYAVIMNYVSLDAFEACIATLVKAQLVKRHPSHLLEWIGPRPTNN